MDYEGLDSSGTDDDLPPSHRNRVSRQGRSSGNGRSFVGSVPYPRTHIDMETQIHNLEQEAYCAVLRAFKAQADAITWEKESLITELRKELRVSDDEHRELLSKVNSEDVIRRIREWRQGGVQQAALYGSSQHMHDVLPSPTISGSRKKQRTSQPQHLPGPSAARSTQYPPSAPAFSRQYSHRSSSGLVAPNTAAEADSLIGRKVWTRWPEDNSFYEATITDYNPIEGRHALVYAMHTPEESWEWVDLKEISSEDIRWDGEDPGISHRGGHVGTGQGFRRSFVRSGPGPGSGRGRGFARGQSRKEYLPSQNGVAKKPSDDIEISNTEKLVKEVERIFDASHLDPAELAKTKKMLKDHEQALADALARLGDASDGESDGEQEGQFMDQH